MRKGVKTMTLIPTEAAYLSSGELTESGLKAKEACIGPN